ncbi:MAG TPA: radical SAM family heme chaperone HemW [Bacteroidales bacterium]|nr:radical SAM family heme chaperone HemW [Bacteroidales bacterium]
MCGIYIHIPFCKSKCSYCDFYSVANTLAINDFVEALLKEIEIKKNDFERKTVKTIYFGGGTPSRLSVLEINRILDCVYKNYRISNDAEVTFEANPEDLNVNYLLGLRNCKINRLSIGLQSLDDNVLKLMRRRHNAGEGLNAVNLANKYGFENISVDFIYGIDGISLGGIQEQLETIVKLPVKHISAYHLGIEKGTLMYRRLKEGKMSIIDEILSFEQYNLIVNFTAQAGFLQYEISNFAKDGFMSRHNSAYWSRKEYLGFGPSAHSFLDNIRTFNTSSVATYCKKIKSGEKPGESEILSKSDDINENIMLALRTTNGLDMIKFEETFGRAQTDRIKSVLKTINQKYYVLENGFLKFTTEGMFVSDSIISSLFV